MRITTGSILTAHGIRGEVKVKPATDNPRRFRKGGRLFLGEGEEALVIERVRPDKNDILILKFKDHDDRNWAEAQRGKLLCVNREDVTALPEGEYYIFQLEGIAVYEGDTYLGSIKEVMQNGTNDVYMTENRDTGCGLMIPALKQVVKEVDIAAKRMVVELPKGLKEACSYEL